MSWWKRIKINFCCASSCTLNEREKIEKEKLENEVEQKKRYIQEENL
tara:strand:- start:772 stop:912 length:141 start_codon:yes stop_codon:yes gene_type:complete